MLTAIVIGTALIGFYMAWNIGANDVANSMGCAVGSQSLSIRNAVIVAAICEFAGSVLVGAHVTDTVRKGIVDPTTIATLPGLTPSDGAALLILGMVAALLSAAVWLNIATWMGMPVSTTHSIVGAVAGFGIVAAGWSAVHWGKLGQIVLSWFVSPVAGGLLGFLSFQIISKLILGHRNPSRAAIRIAPWIVFFVVTVVTLSVVYKGLTHLVKEKAAWLTDEYTFGFAILAGLIACSASSLLIARSLKSTHHAPLPEQLNAVERVFMPLVVITSGSVAFSHGANDVANAIGPLAAVVDIVNTHAIKMAVSVPLWVLVLGGCGIVLGLATYGYRVMHTIGAKLTEITPTRAVAANISAAATVLLCTRLRLPVSTSHTLVGAVLGIGLARGLAGINRSVARSIFGAWLITVPVAAVLSIIFFLLGKVFFFDMIREALI